MITNFMRNITNTNQMGTWQMTQDGNFAIIQKTIPATKLKVVVHYASGDGSYNVRAYVNNNMVAEKDFTADEYAVRYSLEMMQAMNRQPTYRIRTTKTFNARSYGIIPSGKGIIGNYVGAKFKPAEFSDIASAETFLASKTYEMFEPNKRKMFSIFVPHKYQHR